MPEEKNEEQKAPSLEELIAMPLTEAEARVQLANLDIQLAQCNQEKAAADARIADIMAIRAVVLRRILNPREVEAQPDGDARG